MALSKYIETFFFIEKIMDVDLNKLFRNMSIFKLLRCYWAIANTQGLLDVYVLNELIFKRNLLPKWVEQNKKIVGLYFIVDALVDSKTEFNSFLFQNDSLYFQHLMKIKNF